MGKECRECGALAVVEDVLQYLESSPMLTPDEEALFEACVMVLEGAKERGEWV